jgi:hypothetical protein
MTMLATSAGLFPPVSLCQVAFDAPKSITFGKRTPS